MWKYVKGVKDVRRCVKGVKDVNGDSVARTFDRINASICCCCSMAELASAFIIIAAAAAAFLAASLSITASLVDSVMVVLFRWTSECGIPL
jgi:hypothetical protein